MNWRWVSLTALLGALVIGYGTFKEREATPRPSASAPSLPTYYVRNAIIKETAADGSLATQIAAARIEVSPETDDLTMSQVHATYHQGAEQSWRLTADEGYKPGTSPVLHLYGRVELEPLQDDFDARLQTEELAVDTEKEEAFSTRSPVDIRFGQHAMQVQGFRFDMNEQRLYLQAGEGRYAQP